MNAEIFALLEGWRTAFGDLPGGHAIEESAKVNLSAELLRCWFGDAMLQVLVRIADLQRASVVDLLRLLDYPNDYVPVLTRTHRIRPVHPPGNASTWWTRQRSTPGSPAAISSN